MNEPEVIKPSEGNLDIAGLASLVGGFLGPLAEQQASVQKHAIDADLEKHRLTVQLTGQTSNRGFILSVCLLALAGGTLAALISAGKYDLAANVLWYIGGGLSGYGMAAMKKAEDKA